jgi:predicted dithiol-disulfide oxidoreductase (DUF899 family)
MTSTERQSTTTHARDAADSRWNASTRAYFTAGRGVEALGPVWTLLDLTPLGRQEDWEDSPEGYPKTPGCSWWRRHDEYEEAARSARR